MNDTEKHRAECEARHWLRVTGGKRGKVDALIAQIVKRRGLAAGEKLRNNMRKQWKTSQTPRRARND